MLRPDRLDPAGRLAQSAKEVPHKRIAMKWLRYALVIAVLSIAYYFLAAVLLERMPYASLPWWMTIWLSRRAGMLAWFGVLTAAGAIVAAVPVALILAWRMARHRLQTAFAVGALTAAVATASLLVADYSPFGRAPAFSITLWLNSVALFLVLFLAVPLLVWVVGTLYR